MTFDILQKVIKENKIPTNVQLVSDSGWECDATEIDGAYYNKAENKIVFTQQPWSGNNYQTSPDWERIYGEITY